MLPAALLSGITPDFSYFDNLYCGQEDQYIEMLDLYVQEYTNYKKTISQAIASGNIDEFRKAKHKIIYSLHLLKLDSVKDHLDTVGNRIAALGEGERLLESKTLDGAFEEILLKLGAKKDKTV